MWMAPEQVRFMPIGDEQAAYARQLADECSARGMRVTVDDRNEKIGYKIRAAQLEKIPYMIVIGEKEMTEGTVSVRSRKKGDLGVMASGEFIEFADKQIKDKTKGEIILRSRTELDIIGVDEVINFDEEQVHLKSVDGEMMVEGTGIKIDTLDTERGVVKLNGRINAIYYASDPDKVKKGFLGKLMR